MESCVSLYWLLASFSEFPAQWLSCIPIFWRVLVSLVLYRNARCPGRDLDFTLRHYSIQFSFEAFRSFTGSSH